MHRALRRVERTGQLCEGDSRVVDDLFENPRDTVDGAVVLGTTASGLEDLISHCPISVRPYARCFLYADDTAGGRSGQPALSSEKWQATLASGTPGTGRR